MDSTIVILWVGAILKLRRRWSMHQYLTGKVLRSCVVICSIEGLSYEDWLEYFEHEPVNPQSDEIIE